MTMKFKLFWSGWLALVLLLLVAGKVQAQSGQCWNGNWTEPSCDPLTDLSCNVSPPLFSYATCLQGTSGELRIFKYNNDGNELDDISQNPSNWTQLMPGYIGLGDVSGGWDALNGNNYASGILEANGPVIVGNFSNFPYYRGPGDISVLSDIYISNNLRVENNTTLLGTLSVTDSLSSGNLVSFTNTFGGGSAATVLYLQQSGGDLGYFLKMDGWNSDIDVDYLGYFNSTGDFQIRIDRDGNSTNFFRINNGANSTVLEVDEAGQTKILGNLVIDKNQNNGAVVINPSSNGIGVNPMFRFQTAETGIGDNAPMVITRNAYFQTSDDNYYRDDTSREAQRILFNNNGDIVFSSVSAAANPISWIDNMVIKANGNIGIGVSSPGVRLEVDGNIKGNFIAADGTDCPDNYILQKQSGSWACADGSSLGSSYWAPDTNNSADIRSTNSGGVIIGGTGKLTVSLIDPVYTIGGEQYATYGLSGIGVKEELSGVIKLQPRNGLWEGRLEFDNQPPGSDLWLFGKITNIKNNWDDLSVLLTPAFPGQFWYEKDKQNGAVMIYAKPTSKVSGEMEISYRLLAPRFDADKWGNYAEGDFEGINLDKLLPLNK